MSRASDHAAAYQAWQAEKAGLEAPYRAWFNRTRPPGDDRWDGFEAALAVWQQTEEYRDYQARWDAWVRRRPQPPMYWVNPDDDENFIGVGDDGGLVFMPVRDAGGEGIDPQDMPRFRAWLAEVFD